jgi:hypothetical protein
MPHTPGWRARNTLQNYKVIRLLDEFEVIKATSFNSIPESEIYWWKNAAIQWIAIRFKVDYVRASKLIDRARKEIWKSQVFLFHAT